MLDSDQVVRPLLFKIADSAIIKFGHRYRLKRIAKNRFVMVDTSPVYFENIVDQAKFWQI